jgi:hypothetical protein
VCCGKYNENTAPLCRYCNAILPAAKNILYGPSYGDEKGARRKETLAGKGRYLIYLVTYGVLLAGGIVLLSMLINLLGVISKLAKALNY